MKKFIKSFIIVTLIIFSTFALFEAALFETTGSGNYNEVMSQTLLNEYRELSKVEKYVKERQETLSVKQVQEARLALYQSAQMYGLPNGCDRSTEVKKNDIIKQPMWLRKVASFILRSKALFCYTIGDSKSYELYNKAASSLTMRY